MIGLELGIFIVDVDHLSVHGDDTRSPGELWIVGLGEPQNSLLYEVDALRVEWLLGGRLVAAVVASVYVSADDLLFVEETS